MSIGAGAGGAPRVRISGSLSPRGLVRAAPPAARDIAFVLLALVAVVWVWIWVRGAVEHGTVAFDFRGTLWNPGRAILDGANPYPDAVRSELEVGNPAVYPPLLMWLVAPLTMLPWGLGVAVWTGMLSTSLFATLWLLGVRDARCYALAAISAPAVGSLVLGNATLLLLPAVALAWRWRDRWFRAGIVVGMAIAAKLLLWPLVFWLLGTRRYRAAALAAVAAMLGVVLPWAAIGFDGFLQYPDLVRLASDVYAVHSYSVATILSGAGLESEAASRGALAAGLTIAVVAWAFGRRGDDRAAISLALLAAVLGSPILWPYYFAFLLVPLALRQPRFTTVWALLPLLWLVPLLPKETLNASDVAPGGVACCPPEDVPAAVWQFMHSPPRVVPALGFAALAVALVGWCIRSEHAFRGESARS